MNTCRYQQFERRRQRIQRSQECRSASRELELLRAVVAALHSLAENCIKFGDEPQVRG